MKIRICETANLISTSVTPWSRAPAIRLDTPKVAGAGTNADVEGRIIGTLRNSAWRVLDIPNHDDREQGDKDAYKLYFEDSLGDIAGLELRVKKADNDAPDWLLGTAWICKVAEKRLYKLPYNKWIKPTSHASWVFANLNSVQEQPGQVSSQAGYLW